MLKEFKILFILAIVIFHSCTGQERKRAEKIIDPVENQKGSYSSAQIIVGTCALLGAGLVLIILSFIE